MSQLVESGSQQVEHLIEARVEDKACICLANGPGTEPLNKIGLSAQ